MSVTVPDGYSEVGSYHTHPHSSGNPEGEGFSGNPGDAQYYENHYWLGTGYVADTSSRNMYRYTPGGRDATPRNGVYGEKVEHIPDPSNQ